MKNKEIECASCGVMATTDRADFGEGDGGMIPDRWFCHKCQALERLRETESLFCEICGESFCDCDDADDDYDDWDRTDPNLCESCGGDLDVFQVCNDCDV